MAKEDPKTSQAEAVETQETDVLKLFIIIMALCTVGIGFWGGYKAYALSSTTKDIDRVHSPIGIDIQAETPEEIGVSIVAELILERAKR